MMCSAIQREAVGHNAVLKLRSETQHRNALRIAEVTQMIAEKRNESLVPARVVTISKTASWFNAEMYHAASADVHVDIFAHVVQARWVALLAVAYAEVDGK